MNEKTSRKGSWIQLIEQWAARTAMLLLLLLTVPAVVQAQSYTNTYGIWSYMTTNDTISIARYTGSGGDVTVPDMINGLPVTSIGESAFQSCTSLTNITIPNSVSSIGNSAFGQCTRLTAITVDALNSVYSSVAGVLFNKSQTMLLEYPEGKAGSQYTIPNSVTSIGDGAWCDGAFSRCTGLTNITIPNSVTSIGRAAFNGCSSLTSVTIPDSVTSIEDGVSGMGPSSGAFAFCHSLTNVTIGDRVTHLGSEAFYGCALTSVTIANSVTSIGGFAFYVCDSLTSVYFKGNAPTVDSSVFAFDNNATVYYLPGTAGWGSMFGGLPTALWSLPHPLILNNVPGFGVQTNGFGFIISWAINVPVIVEASTTLVHPTWSPISTNTLSSSSADFSDPQWTNYPARFYRLRSP